MLDFKIDVVRRFIVCLNCNQYYLSFEQYEFLKLIENYTGNLTELTEKFYNMKRSKTLGKKATKQEMKESNKFKTRLIYSSRIMQSLANIQLARVTYFKNKRYCEITPLGQAILEKLQDTMGGKS